MVVFRMRPQGAHLLIALLPGVIPDSGLVRFDPGEAQPASAILDVEAADFAPPPYAPFVNATEPKLTHDLSHHKLYSVLNILGCKFQNGI